MLVTMKVKTDSPSPNPRTGKGPRGSKAPAPGERAGKVLQAAGEVFLSRGFAGASLDTIVAKSGGSLRDLYQVFGNKEALFLRVMDALCEEVLAPLRGLALDEKNQQLPIEEVLLAMGRTIMRVLLAPRALALHRQVVSEGPRFPTLGKVFFQMGPSSAKATLAAFLDNRAQGGQLVIQDPRAASAIFIHALISDLHLRALTGGKVTRSEVEERVQEVVRIFLNGVRGTEAGLPRRVPPEVSPP